MASWKSAWEDNKIHWHFDGVHPMVEQHIEKLTNNRKSLKLFLPLCGKTVDILYLADQGHEVVGVEFHEMAIHQFFKENDISYTTKPIPEIDGTLYENVERKIKLYCCDFFKFNSTIEGSFDSVWDRGSLEAIEKDKREKYVEAIKSMCKPNALYLLETADRPEGEGPPFNVSTDDIKKLFGLGKQPEQLDYLKLPSMVPDNIKAEGWNGFFFYDFIMP